MTLQPADVSDTPTLRAYAHEQALIAGIDADMFVRVIDCENRDWEPGLRSRAINKAGRRENSWGLLQINLDPTAHPEVSKKEATDPFWAIQWGIQQWKAGRAWQWTCYNWISTLHED